MIAEEEVLAYLEHYGVKGQRWGVRRNGTSGGTRTGVGTNIKKLAKRNISARKQIRKATKAAAAKPKEERTKSEQRLVIARRIDRGLLAVEALMVGAWVASAVKTSNAKKRPPLIRDIGSDNTRVVEYIGNITYAKTPIAELMPGR